MYQLDVRLFLFFSVWMLQIQNRGISLRSQLDRITKDKKRARERKTKIILEQKKRRQWNVRSCFAIGGNNLVERKVKEKNSLIEMTLCVVYFSLH